MSSILEEIFSREFGTVESKPLHQNHGQVVDVVEFPCVHKDDSEPVSIIWPDLKQGPWIAGGAALRWFQDQAVGENDIDVFCASEEQAQRVIDDIKSYGRYSTKWESDNAVTLTYYTIGAGKEWTIQIIKRRYFMSLKDVIDNFDITVCQIGTAGNDWLLGQYTARDIRERNLRMKLPLQPDAVKRLTKYWTYGYRPVEGLLESVQNNPLAKKEFHGDNEYETAF